MNDDFAIAAAGISDALLPVSALEPLSLTASQACQRLVVSVAELTELVRTSLLTPYFGLGAGTMPEWRHVRFDRDQVRELVAAPERVRAALRRSPAARWRTAEVARASALGVVWSIVEPG